MLINVKEDRRAKSPIRSSRGYAGQIIEWFALTVAVAAYAAPVKAQTPPAGAKDFKASVLDLSGAYQRLTVPIHRSVTVETTIEATRADVAARNIADVQVISPTRMLIRGDEFGTTSVVLMGVNNKQYVFEVSVELDLTQYNDTLKSIDPQSDAKATSVKGNIVLVGTVSSAERAKRMVELGELFLPVSAQGVSSSKVQNHLEVAGQQQVLLRCVVAEVSRSASRELGVNGFLAGENFRDGFVINQLGGINPINIGAAADALVTENIPFLTGEDGVPLLGTSTLSLGFPRVQMQLFMKAMADNKLLSVLAEPNLVAISGEMASFLAGGEFPILVPQGDFRVTVEFKEYGVRLNFTPVVQGHQQIRLRVAPEVSELDFTAAVTFQGFTVPGLKSRSTETTIELGSGQTIAIAGLLSEEVRSIASRIPGIGDVPVLGALFRSVNYQRALSELVVLVTPEIVSPLDAHQVSKTPNHDLVQPNDFELYALGLLDGSKPGCCSHGNCGKCPHPHGEELVPSEPDELSIHGPWGLSNRIDVR